MVNIYQKVRCHKLEDHILRYLITPEIITRLLCLPNARKSSMDLQRTDCNWAWETVMRIVTPSIRTIFNVRYGCRHISVVLTLHQSQNTSFAKLFQGTSHSWIPKFGIAPLSSQLNCWQETKTEQVLIISVFAIPHIQTLSSLYSLSWDFIISMGSSFSPSLTIDHSISFCSSPFFPWLPCNHWVSLLVFPSTFSRWCQVLI